ncbi:hypothetical protein [Zooshikella sp. RANM57]|uniref:hypothetical protein n=1 Tax=Zooshikella sp. RANM57 TaxID=3425863 RepID=UPI003D6FFE2B
MDISGITSQSVTVPTEILSVLDEWCECVQQQRKQILVCDVPQAKVFMMQETYALLSRVLVDKEVASRDVESLKYIALDQCKGNPKQADAKTRQVMHWLNSRH